MKEQEHRAYTLLINKSKLKSSTNTSTLMAGFALVAIVEIGVADETPSAILIPHALLTALLIFVHLLSLIIATRILPELEAYLSNPEQSVPEPRIKDYHWPVQFVWYLSNVVGVVLFLMQMVFVAYVKFYPKNAEKKNRIHVGTATMALVVLMLLVSAPFIIFFFRTLSKQKLTSNTLSYVNQSSLNMEANV